MEQVFHQVIEVALVAAVEALVEAVDDAKVVSGRKVSYMVNY